MSGKNTKKATKNTKNNPEQGKPMPEPGRTDNSPEIPEIPSPQNASEHASPSPVLVDTDDNTTESRIPASRRAGTSPDRRDRQQGNSTQALRARSSSPLNANAELNDQRIAAVEDRLDSMESKIDQLITATTARNELDAAAARNAQRDKGKGVDPAEHPPERLVASTSQQHGETVTVDNDPGTEPPADIEEQRAAAFRAQRRQEAADNARRQAQIRSSIQEFERRMLDVQREIIREFDPAIQSEIRAHVGGVRVSPPPPPTTYNTARRAPQSNRHVSYETPLPNNVQEEDTDDDDESIHPHDARPRPTVPNFPSVAQMEAERRRYVSPAVETTRQSSMTPSVLVSFGNRSSARIESLLRQYVPPGDGVLRAESGERPRTNIKCDAPVKFNGRLDRIPDHTTSAQIFENWVVQLLHWMRVYRSFYDPVEVQLAILSTTLEGEALAWYTTQIDIQADTEDGDVEYTFRDVILLLEKQFVYRSSSRELMFKYDSIYQGSKTVTQTYDKLRIAASMLDETPTKYMFRIRFMDALNDNIRTRLLEQGFTAEAHRIKTLYLQAYNQEESLRYLAIDQKIRHKKGVTTGSSTSRSHIPVRTYDNTRDARCVVTQTTRTNEVRVQRPVERNPSNNRTYNNDRNRTNTSQRPFRPAVTFERHASTSRQFTDKPRVYNNQGNNQNSSTNERRCYNCGRTGHFSANCPNRSRDRSRVQVHAVDAAQGDETDREDGRHSPSVHSEPDDVRMEFDDTADEGAHDQQSQSSNDNDDNYQPDDIHDEIDVHAIHIDSSDDRTLITEDNESVFSALTLVEPELTVNDPVMVAHAQVSYKTLDPRREIEPQITSAERSTYPFPVRDYSKTRPIAVYIECDGVTALTLLDGGSTTNLISLEFVRSLNMQYYKLDHQVNLKMACANSQAPVRYCAAPKLSVGPLKDVSTACDIANLNKYQMILGTPFLRAHNIALDYSTSGTVHFNPTITSSHKVQGVELIPKVLTEARTSGEKPAHTQAQPRLADRIMMPKQASQAAAFRQKFQHESKTTVDIVDKDDQKTFTTKATKASSSFSRKDKGKAITRKVSVNQVQTD